MPDKLSPYLCHSCNSENKPQAKFCRKCGSNRQGMSTTELLTKPSIESEVKKNQGIEINLPRFSGSESAHSSAIDPEILKMAQELQEKNRLQERNKLHEKSKLQQEGLANTQTAKLAITSGSEETNSSTIPHRSSTVDINNNSNYAVKRSSFDDILSMVDFELAEETSSLNSSMEHPTQLSIQDFSPEIITETSEPESSLKKYTDQMAARHFSMKAPRTRVTYISEQILNPTSVENSSSDSAIVAEENTATVSTDIQHNIEVKVDSQVQNQVVNVQTINTEANTVVEATTVENSNSTAPAQNKAKPVSASSAIGKTSHSGVYTMPGLNTLSTPSNAAFNTFNSKKPVQNPAQQQTTQSAVEDNSPEALANARKVYMSLLLNCHGCKRQVRQGDRFCISCGTAQGEHPPLELKSCPACMSNISPCADFCNFCGMATKFNTFSSEPSQTDQDTATTIAGNPEVYVPPSAIEQSGSLIRRFGN